MSHSMIDLVDRFLPVLDRLERDLGATPTIDELSKTAFFSKFHFQRLFRELCGRSVGEYVHARRMTEASELLLHTSWSVERIAVALGYQSARTFRKSFSLHYGMAPLAYRAQGTAYWHKYYAAFSEGELEHLHSGKITLEPEIAELPERRFAGFSRLLPMDSPDSALLFDEARALVPAGSPAASAPRCFVWNSPSERLLRMHHFAVVHPRGLLGELPAGCEELVLPPMRVARFRHKGSMAVYEWSKRYIWQEWNGRGEWEIDEDGAAELGFRFDGPVMSPAGFEVTLPLKRRIAPRVPEKPAT